MGLFSMLGRLGLDTSDFQAGIKRAESATTGFANKLGGDIKSKLAGAFTVGAVAAWSKTVLDHYGKIVDLADAYRVTTEEIQKMQASEMLNGVEVGSLAQVMLKIQEARQKAVGGDEKMIGVFGRMGIALNELQSDSVGAYSMLEKVGLSLSSRTDATQAQANFLDVAGTKSAKLLKAVQDINQESPITILSDSQVRAIDDAGDRLAVIWQNLKAISGLSFVKTTNALDDVADIVRDIWTGAKFQGLSRGDENSFTMLQRIVSNRLALNRAMRESTGTAPQPETDRERWAARWSRSGPLFGSDNPLFEMMGRDAGEMLGPGFGSVLPGREKMNLPGFRSSADSALQSQGGYWFGAVDSSKQDLAAMRADIKRIADSVNKVATQ